MIYDKIVDKINKNPFKLYVGFFKPMKLGKLGDRQRISLGLTPDIPGIDESDHISNFISLVDSQFNDSISKIILKYLLNNSDKEYLDFTSSKMSSEVSFEVKRKIIYDVHKFGFKNLITGSRLGSNLQDSSDFLVSNSLQRGIMLTNIGSLSGKAQFYVDPVMKWEDNFILLFDDIYVDINNFSAQIVNDMTLFPRIEVSFNLAFDVVSPKVLYIFEDNYMNGYSDYKQINRDRKINKILEE